MAEFQYNRIRARLLEEVAPLIDLSDVANKPAGDLEMHRLSRSVAAAALQIEAGVSAEAAAAAVVDGGGDNGIDAFAYDSTVKTLILVQAKWSQSHTASIDQAGVLAFLAGVQDLLAQKKSKFNQKIQDRWAIISDALDNAARIRLVTAFPGSGRIAEEIQARIDEFVSGQNDTSDTFFATSVSQKELFQHFAADAAPPQIDLTINLAHYGRVEAPLLAVYGQVSAVEVGAWYKEHGNKLFAGNIRHFVGLGSDVNADIARTLTESPENFWYYNNGITMLAQELSRRPGPTDRSIGVFDCKRVTIVNGAQTVGTIGRSNLSEANPAFVQARIILLDDPETSTGRTITRATNTQNRINARNFVALDPVQDRIRGELLLEGVNYEFREGEPLESVASGFEFIEAITTLACASPEISHVALAKGYVGGLYADLDGPPYKALFNPSTDSKRLWSLVRIARRVEQALRARFDDPSATERGIIVHGNRFTLHGTLRRLSAIRGLERADEFTAEEIEAAAVEVVHRTRDVIDGFYEGAYLAPLFKNVGKCTDIRNRVEAPGAIPAW